MKLLFNIGDYVTHWSDNRKLHGVVVDTEIKEYKSVSYTVEWENGVRLSHFAFQLRLDKQKLRESKIEQLLA